MRKTNKYILHISIVILLVLLSGLHQPVFADTNQNGGNSDSCGKLNVANIQEVTTCNLHSTSSGGSCNLQSPEPGNTPLSSYTVSLQISSGDGRAHTFTWHNNRHFCLNGDAVAESQGLSSCTCPDNTVTDSQTNSVPTTITMTEQAPQGYQGCGSYQHDFYIDAVDGDSNCTYDNGSSRPGASGRCETGISCPANPPTYSISGSVYEDANRNGINDPGEKNYGGAAINISGATGVSTATAPSGKYSVGGLFFGNYTVAITVPAGYVPTTATSRGLSLGPNGTVDFGIAPNYTITGNVFVDTNKNGVQDAGESNYNNATITRTGVSSGTTTTNAGGAYTFANLGSGNYTVGVNLPAGYTNTTATSKALTLGPNGTANFGIVPNYTISGNVYVDTNKNGVQDNGETAYANATITRTGASSGTTTTNAGGAYSFGNLLAGNYTVSVTVPAGYTNTTAISQATTLGPNKTVNFGIVPNYTISGTVFVDTNKNGVQDAGETTYANGTITRTGASSGTTTTNAGGTYTFGNLLAGNYTVAVTVPAGYINTTATSQAVTLGPNKTANFGIVQTYTITGNVFNDGNKNHIKDAVEINDPNKPVITSSQGTVTTGANGIYTISNITSGNVTVSYTSLPPVGFIMTYPLNGPPPSFGVTVGPACNVNGATSATCTAGNISNLNFAINNNVKPWMQSLCGDMRNDNGINIPVPIGQFGIGTSASCLNPGIAFTGDTNASFTPGQESSKNQVVGGNNYPELYKPPSSNTVFSSYSYLLQKAQGNGVLTINLASVCTLSNCTLPANLTHGLYQANGDVTLNAYTFPANQDYVFLINGNLTINGNVIVPAGSNSTAMFSTAGNITVSTAVGSAPAVTTANLAAIFSTDKSFIMPTTNNCTDLRLNVAGTVIVNAGQTNGTLQNSRDLCPNNITVPSLQIVPRLDFVLNLPDFVKIQSVTSKEINP